MLVIVNKSGQLSNRLSIFAHLIKFSLEHGASVYNPSFDEYAYLFEGTGKGLLIKDLAPRHFFDQHSLTRSVAFRVARKLSIILPGIPCLRRYFVSIVLKNDEDRFALDSPENIQLLKSGKIFFLSGWLFRNQNLAEKHSDFIRGYFRPVQKHLANIERTIHPIRKKFRTLVGIHIRRGDYKMFQNGIYYYDVEQYKTVMENIASVFCENEIAFLICSNEDIDLNTFRGQNVFKGPGHAVEDLYSLAACDYIAGPPSTFTMWASFYGKKPLYMIKNIADIPTCDSFRIINI